MDESNRDISARVERLLTAQPAAPPEARRVRRSFPIQRRWTESRRHVGISVKVDDEYAAAYRRPGQYVTLKVAEWPPRFYVIASRARADCWEFLIDRHGEIGPELTRFDVGDELLVSLPEGVGFDPAEAAGEMATLFCTGSGLATMRPLVEWWLDDDSARPDRIALYYGERAAADFAYGQLLADWKSEGLEIYRAAEAGPTEQFPHRYVQHAFDADHPPVDDSTFVYLSGAPVMIHIIAEKLLKMGVAPSRVKVNV